MIVLDTTVFAYASGEAHLLREPARWLLGAHAAGRIDATTTVEVLQGFMHVRARRVARPLAVATTQRFAEAFDLLMTTLDDLTLGTDLFRRHGRLGAFDAVLAAVVIGRRAQALVSADRAFADVAGLTFIDLAAPDLERVVLRTVET